MTKILLLNILFLLASCNIGSEGEGSSGGGLFVNHSTSETELSLSLPADSTYTENQDIDFILSHASTLTVTGTPRVSIELTSGTVYAEYHSGSGTTDIIFRYTVSSGDQDSDGVEIGTNVDLNSGTILTSSDSSSIELSFDSQVSTGILIGPQSPEITSLIEPVSATYAEGSEILLQLNFEEIVIVTDTPHIALNIGGTTRYATYTDGSGTTGLEFSYTITASENDSDGIEISGNNIDLNGGTITSSTSGLDALLNFSDYKDSTSGVIVNTSTGITAPDQVAQLSTAPTTDNTTLGVSWSVPADNDTSIINYSLQYRLKGDTTWSNISPSPVSNSTTVSGLSEGTTYEFRVAANNGLLGPFSDVNEAEIFSIASLNPIAWLSATDITNGGTEPSDGDKIASWEDLSGVASAATESVEANQPTYATNVQNGLPAVRFDGHTRGLEGTFTRINNSGLTVFVVGKMDQNNSRKCFFEFYSTTATRRGFFFNYGFNEASTNYQLDDTTFNLWTAFDDGSKTDFWENGSNVYTDITNWGPTDFTGSGAYVLGDDQTSGDQINGYIGEFLIFDQELTDEEKTKVETYLSNKWGTP